MHWQYWPPDDASLMPDFQARRDGKLEEAHLFLTAKALQQPDCADIFRGLGNVAWSSQDFSTALIHFSTALRLQSWSPMNWGNLGLVRRDLGQPQAAIAAFQVALGLDPDYAPALNEWANVLFDIGLYHEALPLYDASLAIDNKRAVVYHNKGVCLCYLGRLPEAIHYFETALTLEPNYHYSQEELQRLCKF
jgi:tetratricopeptide (TPR) repeat protein